MILVIVGVFWFVCWYVARQTAFGRHLYAIGGDREAARLAGVRTTRVSIALVRHLLGDRAPPPGCSS